MPAFGGFRYRPSLPKMPEGAERQVIDQFRAIQNDLDALRRPTSAVTPIINGRTHAAQIEQLVLLEPTSAGVLVTIPQGNAENVTKRIRIAVVGGLLTPGAAVSIVGRKGTINGQQTLYIQSYRLVELVSVGERGWWHST
jgi:hypothetical protein